MKVRLFILFVLLFAVSAAAAQYCPSPRLVSAEKTSEIRLSNAEQLMWNQWSNNIVGLRRQVAQTSGVNGQRLSEQLAMIERILQRVEQAKEHNKVEVARILKEQKCRESRPVGSYVKGECIGQVEINPVQEGVVFRSDGVYVAALLIKTSADAKCSYVPRNIVMSQTKQMPKEVFVPDVGPLFDCNNPPPVSQYARNYHSTYKGRGAQFRVFYYQDWEITCVLLGGNYWEVFKKAQYQWPSLPVQVTGDVTSIGKIAVLKRLPEGLFSGVIARTDGKTPTRVVFDRIRNEGLRQGQKVKFTQNGVTGFAITVEPAK